MVRPDSPQVQSLASLARLHVGKESEHYQADLEKILAYVDELRELDVADIGRRWKMQPGSDQPSDSSHPARTTR
jgi:aspartyl/glutamyl-tRNA(Asn/Gln) amidotransferase C subunit